MKGILFFSCSLLVLSLQAVSSLGKPKDEVTITSVAEVEKLYITFNQPKYAPGDTAFFKAQLIEAETKQLSLSKKVISLKMLGADGKTHFFNRVVMQGGSVSNQFVLPKDFAPGVYTLVAYSEDFVPGISPTLIYQAPFIVVGENIFFVEGQGDTQKIDSTGISLTTEKLNYSNRQAVQVNVSIAASMNNGQTEFSAAVVNSDLFDNSTLESREGVSAINENNKVGDQINKPRSYYFRGKLILDSPGTSLRDSTLITFYLNHNDFVYEIYVTDKSGNFDFPLFKNFGDERVYYTATHKGTKLNAQIQLDNTNVENVKPFSSRTDTKTDAYASLSKKRNIIQSSFKFYVNKDSVEEDDVWLDSDFDIELDKFEPFSSMQELLSNIVQMVKYRKQNGNDAVRLFLKEKAMYASADPLYIIDGIMTDNTAYFLKMNTTQIDRIGILRSEEVLNRFGALGKNGILLVKTKSTSREELPTNQHELSITGINKAIPFTSPSYVNAKQINIPDLRSTLYWNPKIVTDNQGKASFSFYTGDATGNFKIRIEGMTKNGILFTKELPFTVSYEKP